MKRVIIFQTSVNLSYRFSFSYALLTSLLLLGNPELSAQSKSTAITVDSIWSILERQLDQTPTDSVARLAIPLVRGRCGSDLACQYSIYKHIMLQLERRFRILGAISICGELENVVRQQANSAELGGVYLNFSRYYDALGLDQQATLYLDKAVVQFEKIGSFMAQTEARMTKLERTTKYRSLEVVLPEMDSLLAQAERKEHTRAINFLNARILNFKLIAQRYEEAERHIVVLEQIPLSQPARRIEIAMKITAARGRARLAEARKDTDATEAQYQKILQLLKEQPDPWMEVNTLLRLTNLEWSRGNRARAKAYLGRAETRATEAPVEDQLTDVYWWHEHIAEQEGRLSEALAYTKKHYRQKEAFQDRSAGFDLQNYYLQQEKEQLATEKENQALELRLNKVQLRNSLIVAISVLVLAGFLLFAYYKQRSAKRKLADQNVLIQQQAELLKSLDAAKTRFFANISHELRTPLTLMLGPIQTLLKGNQLTDKQSNLLQMANRSGSQLGQLINEILDLRKLESGAMTLQVQPTALVAFFCNYIAQFESLAERHEIALHFETSIKPDVAILIDRTKCRQIFYNLLSNAFKFIPDGGSILVALSLDEQDQLQLSVADTGPGIHPDDLPHVFDRFFQTSRADKPAEGGTGIGLNLCREYASLFGGAITAESTLGKGNTFTLTFPVVPSVLPADAQVQEVGTEQYQTPHLAAASENAQPQASDTSTKPTILVVEDNPDLRDYIRLMLSKKYGVHTAEHGEAALQLLQTDSPDAESHSTHQASGITPQLILSDLMMPVMDGYQLLEALKADDATRHIPVVMLTARAEARDKLKALRIGVDDYLTKPFDEEELLARIDNLLKHQVSRQQEVVLGDELAVPVMSQQDREWLEGFEVYVQQHFSEDILSVSSLANVFAMSESTLLRQIKRLTGLTPAQYLQEVRLDAARQLLENRVYDSISRIATEVGYRDARSFSRSFRERFGKLPSEVRGV